MAEFCRRARLRPVSFYAWRRRWRDEHPFVEVKIADEAAHGVPQEAAPTPGVLELRLPRERRVLIPRGFDPATLRALLAVLEGGAADRAGAEARP